jgi:flagellar biosynthesis anti-sigma factor FlgM
MAPANEIIGMSLTPALRERLEKSLESVPDVDSQRVDEIKKALKSGFLQINANDIADAMIRLDRSLGD